MTLCCKNCKCDVCGNMHECEIICERIIELDSTNINKCKPILSCNMFTSKKDHDVYTEWKCEIKKLVKRGDLE